MILYILLVGMETIFYIITMNKNYKFKKGFVFLSFILLVITSGFRELDLGNDTQVYCNFFDRVKNINISILSIKTSFEIGFVLFTYLLSRIATTRIFILCISTITLFFIIKSIYDNSNNIYMSIFLFLGLRFFFESMNVLREFIAIALIMYGFKYVRKKCFFKYFMVVICAVLFHFSAIIAIAIYPIYNMKKGKKTKIILGIATIAITVLIEPLCDTLIKFIPKYSIYISRINSFEIYNILKTLFYFLIYYIVMLERKKQHSEELEKFGNLIFLMLCINLLSVKMNIIERVAHYINILIVIVIPNVISGMSNKKKRITVKIIVYLMVFIYTIALIYLRPEWFNISNFSLDF